MISSKLRLVVPAVLILFAVGCENGTKQRRDEFNQKLTERVERDKFNEPMIRNAAAYNMTLSDGHFFPHTGELNGLGAQQLDRISETLERFNGMVRYETRSVDEELIATRLGNIKQYLTDTGLDTTSVEVAASLSGGRSVSAMDAIQSKYKALNTAAPTGEAASRQPQGK